MPAKIGRLLKNAIQNTQDRFSFVIRFVSSNIVARIAGSACSVVVAGAASLTTKTAGLESKRFNWPGGRGVRKTDQEIRDLCQKVIRTTEPNEFAEAITALKTALRDFVVTAENKHIARLLKLQKEKEKGIGS